MGKFLQWLWWGGLALMLLSVVYYAVPAQAEFVSAAQLVEALGGSGEQQATARGYIIGVHDAGRTIVHCSPLDTTQDQVVTVVTVFLALHPEAATYTADTVALLAFHQVWPCSPV